MPPPFWHATAGGPCIRGAPLPFGHSCPEVGNQAHHSTASVRRGARVPSPRPPPSALPLTRERAHRSDRPSGGPSANRRRRCRFLVRGGCRCPPPPRSRWGTTTTPNPRQSQDAALWWRAPPPFFARRGGGGGRPDGAKNGTSRVGHDGGARVARRGAYRRDGVWAGAGWRRPRALLVTEGGAGTDERRPCDCALTRCHCRSASGLSTHDARYPPIPAPHITPPPPPFLLPRPTGGLRARPDGGGRVEGAARVHPPVGRDVGVPQGRHWPQRAAKGGGHPGDTRGTWRAAAVGRGGALTAHGWWRLVRGGRGRADRVLVSVGEGGALTRLRPLPWLLCLCGGCLWRSFPPVLPFLFVSPLARPSPPLPLPYPCADHTGSGRDGDGGAQAGPV